MYRSASLSSVLVLVAAVTVARAAAAETQSSSASTDRVTSQALFERGRALFIEGRYAEACPMLEESHRLSPGIGVLLHLGACLEKAEHPAGAWAAFNEAADRAKAEGDLERERVARDRARDLAENLSYLTVRVAPVPLPQDTQIEQDGHATSLATLGLEVPVDPGQHQVVARAQGKQEATRTVMLDRGEHTEVTLELFPTPNQPQATITTPPNPKPLPRSVRPTQPPPPPSPYAWVPWVSAGFGAAGLLTGISSGLVAHFKMRHAREACEGHATNECPDESLRLQHDARFPAHLATAGFAIGVAGFAVAGGYWLLNRSGRTVVTGSVGPQNAYLAVQTHW
jgi:hypothetical protein